MFETAIIVALIAVSGSFAAALIPLLREYLQDKKRRSDERARILSTTKLLRARFGQIGRHSATNLKRLTEIFRAPPRGCDMVVALTKMSLRLSTKSDSDASAREALNLAKVEDIALFPEQLARDVLRLELTARNIEIDLAEAITLFKEKPDHVFRRDEPFQEPSRESRRIESLSITIERCAQDSAELVAKLKEFEQSEFRPSLLSRLFEWIGRLIDSIPGLPKSRRRAFRDEPIHFTDAMSLREVGDWANWKEEQQLIPTAEVAAFLRGALDLKLPPGQDHVDVVTQRFGTINSITHCRHGGKDYCVRVRVNEGIFQYEPGLVKEVFVALALKEKNEGRTVSDETLAGIYRQCVKDPTAPLPAIPFPIGPDIHSAVARSVMRRNPYPCLVSDWIGPSLLSAAQRQFDGFFALGKAVKELHTIRPASYYRNLRDLGEYRYAREFSEDIVGEIRRRNDDVQVIDHETLNRVLDRVTETLSKNKQFCLCHNDLHPNNVFWDAAESARKKIVIVDWDNACISHRYLDFVKIMYWSRLSPDGRLTGDEKLFELFCRGYGDSDKNVKESPIFLALSLLWLFRVFMFERKREAGGRSVPKPFQPAKYYEDHIRICVRALSRRSPP